MKALVELTGLPENVAWVLAGMLLALVAGSLVRLITLAYFPLPPDKRHNRIGSLLTWWILFLLFAAVVLAGCHLAAIGFAIVSLLGLHEFRKLAGNRIAVTWGWWRLTYLAVPIHYLFVYLEDVDLFWTFIPVWVFFLLLVRLVVTGQTSGFLETAGITFLGLMLIVYLFSHAALLLVLPVEANPATGPVGLFVYLVLLTEANDIAQALWGRQFGRHKILPRISPGKTWEGFLLGAATTVALAVLLAPWLTPFADQPVHVGSQELPLGQAPALLVGLVLAVGGFFGDVSMSAIKREVGVKDSGSLLPGQGGVLDRIDSLTFTAPLLFYIVYVFYC